MAHSRRCHALRVVVAGFFFVEAGGLAAQRRAKPARKPSSKCGFGAAARPQPATQQPAVAPRRAPSAAASAEPDDEDANADDLEDDAGSGDPARERMARVERAVAGRAREIGDALLGDRRNGVLVVDGFLGDAATAALLAEARSLRETMTLEAAPADGRRDL